MLGTLNYVLCKSENYSIVYKRKSENYPILQNRGLTFILKLLQGFCFQDTCDFL